MRGDTSHPQLMRQRAALFLPVLTAGAVSMLAPPAQAQQSVSLAGYQKLLRSYQALADQPKPNKSNVDELARRLRDVKTVVVDGKNISVDLSPDADALTTGDTPAKGKKLYETASRRSKTLSFLVIPDGEATNTASAASQAAAILARPEFRVVPENKEDKTPGWLKATGDWFRRQFRAFGRWLAHWWERLFPAPPRVNPGALSGFANFMRFLLYFLVAVGTIIGLYFLGMYLTGKKWNKPQKKRTGTTGLDLDIDAFPDPLGYARDVAARGDYREAVRLVYIASLRRLAGSGLVTLQENRTNWEYQRSLRSRSQSAYDSLLPGTRLFDRIWYGWQNATRDEYEQTLAIHDALPSPVVTTTLPSTGSARTGAPAEKPLAGAGSGGQGGNSW